MEEKESLKDKTVKGTLWSFLERFSVQGISFVVNIIMARVLTPADYGMVAMLVVFTALSQSLVDCGFSQALIRKRDRSQTDNSTVFFFNIGAGVFLYLLLFFCAPLIARFYNLPLLTPLLRVLSLGVLLNSFAVVQRALLTVKIDFKTQSKATLAGALLSAVVGITMAYTGFGVWAIVAQQLSAIALTVILLWFMTGWRPSAVFSGESFRSLFSFGSKLALSGVIDTIYKNLYLFVIGKVYKDSELGFYTRAQQFTEFPSSSFTTILQRVTFPVLCSIPGDSDERLRDIYRRLISFSAFVFFPLMIGLGAVAEPLVNVLLGAKWIPSVILIQIICMSFMWFPIHALNLNLLQVKGRGDLFLRLEIIKKIVGVIIMVATIPFGLVWMCVGMVVSSLVSLVINTHYTGKLINVGFIRQMVDVFSPLAASLLMAVVIVTVNSFLANDLLRLVCGIATGVSFYIIWAFLTHSRNLVFMRELIARKLKK